MSAKRSRDGSEYCEYVPTLTTTLEQSGADDNRLSLARQDGSIDCERSTIDEIR